MDREKKREVIREATVVDGNYKIDPEKIREINLRKVGARFRE